MAFGNTVTTSRETDDAPDLPVVMDLVREDLAEREAQGLKKYGVVLKPFDGNDPLREAYQEALDLVVYLRQALYEKHGR